MPTVIDKDGLTISTTAEILANLQVAFEAIFGVGTNFDSNTPDGQALNIFAQGCEDNLEAIQNIYNAFDPQAAIGTQQDRLYFINGIIRKGATYSYQDVVVTTRQGLTLSGLDAAANDPDGSGYTVSDNLGNQWILLDTQTPVTAGTYTYAFRAKNLGAINSAANTIIVPVTIIIGVVSVNNPTGVSALGTDGETDFAFRTRQAVSFALRGQNSLDSLYSNLLNLEGVISATVLENDNNAPDANGIPAHGSWSIVEGGADADIAQLIYAYRTGGTPMKGADTYDITTIQGQIFTAKFDRPISASLYVEFDIQALQPGQLFDEDAIKQYIVDNQKYNIGQPANTANLTYQAMQAINLVSGGMGVPLNVLISDDGITWFDFLDTITPQYKWVLDVTNISITIL